MKIATMFLLSSLAPMALASSVVYEEAVRTERDAGVRAGFCPIAIPGLLG